MKHAMFWSKKDDKIQCELCPHNCIIQEGKTGICTVRQNRDGTLYSLVYEKVAAMHVDPIEKKPLYHFYPGSRALSLATVGCNLKCDFCQNADISQESEIFGNSLTAEQIIDMAKRQNCISVAYTYNEPTIFYEYAYEICKLAHENRISNVFVTNGFINPGPLKKISKYLDAANVDIKAFSDHFYRELCSARIQPVLDTVRLMKELGIWVEITTLVIPGQNDTHKELKGIAEFIAGIDKEMPWHISRYHPDYKMMMSRPTPAAKLQEAYEIGIAAGLRHIFVGNVLDERHNTTYCPGCGKALIIRSGFSVRANHIKNSSCEFCNKVITGHF